MHLLGACSAGVKGKYLLFSYPGGDGRGIRTAQIARLRILCQSRLIHTIKPYGDGWITEIRCKNNFNRHISVCKIYPLFSLHHTCDVNVTLHSHHYSQ